MHIFAATLSADVLTLAVAFLQEFCFVAAFITFVFEYRHRKLSLILKNVSLRLSVGFTDRYKIHL